MSADQVEALIADMRARVFIGEGGTPILPKLFQVIDTTFDMTDGLKATITWNSRPGRFYSIEGSTDLIDWNPVGGEEVRAAGATTTFELDNLPAGQAQLYFRIVE